MIGDPGADFQNQVRVTAMLTPREGVSKPSGEGLCTFLYPKIEQKWPFLEKNKNLTVL